MMKRGSVICIISVLCLLAFQSMAASALTQNTEVVALKSLIYPDETAVFNVTVTNLQEKADTFKIKVLDPSWTVDYLPVTNYFNGMVLGSGESASTLIKLKPQPGLGENLFYQIAFEVEAVNGAVRTTRYLDVDLRSFSDRPPASYVPDVGLTVKIDDQVDPRKEVAVTVGLKNRNRLNIDTFGLTIESALFKRSVETSLGPLEQKEETYLFQIDDLQKPSLQRLVVTMHLPNNTVIATQEFTVTGYSNIDESTDKIQGFFYTEERHYLTNKGNIANFKELYLPVGAVSKYFTRSNYNYGYVRVEGKGYFHYKIIMNPQDEIMLYQREDFRIFPFLVFVILVVMVLYYLLRSPIVLHKEKSSTTKKQGGISEIKVIVRMRNRTAASVKQVEVIDKVPNIAEVVDQEYVGSLKHEALLKHPIKGTLIKWKMEKLEPHEERVLMYKIRSRLNIFGDFTLPATMVRYSGKSGKFRTSASNQLKIYEG